MVLSMMYASDRPILTGCFSSLIDSMSMGTILYANVMSPLFDNVTLNVKKLLAVAFSDETGVVGVATVFAGVSAGDEFFAGLSCNGICSHTTVNAVPAV